MYPIALWPLLGPDHVCDTSFAQWTPPATPVAASAGREGQSFATANGDRQRDAGQRRSTTTRVGGAKAWQFAVSPSTGAADFGLDTACASAPW